MKKLILIILLAFLSALITATRGNIDGKIHEGENYIEYTWRLEPGALRQGYPNVYWLPPEVPGVKVAFGASGIGADMRLVTKHKDALRESLNGFRLISVRDHFTREMVRAIGPDPAIPVHTIPDPTILEDFPETGVAEILRKHGVDGNRPVLGIMVHGKHALCGAVADHFRRRGFAVVALSMYNPCADVNLGCVLGPYEWAEAIGRLTFCLTDRFHGTVFCLKNNTPFVSVDPRPPGEPIANKILSLLQDWRMEECYENVYSPGYRSEQLIESCDAVLAGWDSTRRTHVAETAARLRKEGRAFVTEMARTIREGAGNAV